MVMAVMMSVGVTCFVISVPAKIIIMMSRAFSPYSLYHLFRIMGIQFLFCFRNPFDALKGPHIEA